MRKPKDIVRDKTQNTQIKKLKISKHNSIGIFLFFCEVALHFKHP